MAASEPGGWRLVVGDDDVIYLSLVEASVHEELFHLNWCDQSRDGLNLGQTKGQGLTGSAITNGCDIVLRPSTRWKSLHCPEALDHSVARF